MPQGCHVKAPILALDPGTTESAFLLYNGKSPVEFGKVPNDALLERLRLGDFGAAPLFIEMIASYGMAVGQEVFETCVWIGRFMECHAGPTSYVYRKSVKIHLCGSMQAKDANIRAALIDKWGGKDTAIGRKKTPGPLYGISSDVWSALAIAVTAWESAKKS